MALSQQVGKYLAQEAAIRQNWWQGSVDLDNRATFFYIRSEVCFCLIKTARYVGRFQVQLCPRDPAVFEHIPDQCVHFG